MNRVTLTFAGLFALLLAAHLCHLHVFWAEETLPLAAAQEMHAGKTLYRDVWFDKPPAIAWLAWAVGARDGALLRVTGALYGILCCWLAFAFARDLWGERAGLWAASLFGFFLVFDFPATAIPLASDQLMIAPHLAAVWMAWRRRALAAGALAGVAFLVSPKAALVLLACALWAQPVLLLAGFAMVCGAGALGLAITGALPAYWDQVWRWGSVYAGTTFLESPLTNGVVRTLNWGGFHAAIVIAAVLGLKDDRRRWLLWIAISAAGVAAGLRFFPRYYFGILPPVALLAAHGFTRYRRAAWLLLLLAIPAARFAPTYIASARGPWRDTAMDQDSRAAAAILQRQSRPGDSLFVWGYRPEIYVYAALPAASRFLDSQPLTGVPADRHLTQSQPLETQESRAHRTELSQTHPVWIVDGLGGYNSHLALSAMPDLQEWLSHYREAGRTGLTIIYRRID